MGNPSIMFQVLGLTVVIAPLLLFAILGLPTLAGRQLKESTTATLFSITVITGLVAALIMLGLMLSTGKVHVPIILGSWVQIPHYHFSIKFVFDRLSVPFVILSFVLCGTISAFASRYMHREPGYNRFFVLNALFVLGMVVTSLAGTIETLFTGWELVGLSSALLVGFYLERPAPVRNGLLVWIVYRISDAALLVASVAMHHLTGEGDFDKLLGAGPWPEGHAALSSSQALLVGLLLLLAAAGKSALVPFSGWLPRAMEGPTPSSAVFYGALSVHLGAFLLLRVSPLLDASPSLSAIVAVVGIATAAYAGLAGRVQTDIKTALTFASLTQVGIIVAEIGLGLPRYIPLIHVLGHGCLRTLQFVRAPSILYDYSNIENALGARLTERNGHQKSWLPLGIQMWLYRGAFQRGYLDALLSDYVVTPFLSVFQWCDRAEQAWCQFLSGSPNPKQSKPGDVPGSGTLEDLL
ncbi:MAG: proton-conducting transporter membrane subunit [Planctomycetales bacterium]